MCTASEGSAETELHGAAWGNEVDTAERLIKSGVDVNIKDSIDETPLHGSVAWNNLDMVKFLLSEGADPNIMSKDGLTPLHWACSHADAKMVELLIEHGAKLQNNHLNESPVEIAKKYNKHDIVKFLKQNS